MRSQHKQQGFSLVELLVAMAIGLVFMAGVVKVYVSTSDAYRKQHALAEVQNNGRFVINFLQNAIMAADYRGCVATSSSLSNDLNNSTAYQYNFAQSLSGNESTGAGSWTPALDAAMTSPLSGNDAITVRGASDFPVPIQAAMTTTSDALSVDASTGFTTGNILMVSNCAGNVDIFQVSGTALSGSTTRLLQHTTGGSNPGNATPSFTAVYDTTSYVSPVSTTGIFLRTNSRGINSLYVVQPSISGSTSPVELAEGVDGMQILYGVRPSGSTTNDATLYLTAKEVDASSLWDNVVMVRVAVLVSSPEPAGKVADNKTYDVLGVNYGPYTDARARRVFTATITLRNRYLRQ